VKSAFAKKNDVATLRANPIARALDFRYLQLAAVQTCLKRPRESLCVHRTCICYQYRYTEVHQHFDEHKHDDVEGDRCNSLALLLI